MHLIHCVLVGRTQVRDSGEDGDSGESGSGEGDDDGVEYLDLSAAGTANCYLIQGAGDYKFKSVIGNTDATVGNVKSVEVLWESFGTDEKPNVGDLIASVSYKNGYVRFSTPENFRDGNAVIAVRNSKGSILWSWHIWCAEEGWKEQVYYNDAGTMMDRNLGATSATPGEVGALGLLYQWGRKDPFMSSSSVKSNSLTLAQSTGVWTVASGGNTALSESNPMTFYNDMHLPYGSWQEEKTVCDPCPAGWRVPDGGENGVWAKTMNKTESFTDASLKAEEGLNFTSIMGDDEVIYYPGSASLTTGGNLFSTSEYWSCSPHPNGSTMAYSLSINDYQCEVEPCSLPSRASAYSVRCLKE